MAARLPHKEKTLVRIQAPLPAGQDGANPSQRSRQSSAARGYGYKWRKLRDEILKENPKCTDCGGIAEEVHHLDGIVTHYNKDNLIPLCTSCHCRRTALETGVLPLK
jgi:5-methylcytosine-specific restriction endonuclease McrA